MRRPHIVRVGRLPGLENHRRLRSPALRKYWSAPMYRPSRERRPPIVLTYTRIRTSRNCSRLGGPEHHRYVRCLDYKVHGEAPETSYACGIKPGSASFGGEYKSSPGGESIHRGG